MAVSAKSRLRHVLIEEPVADAGTNDNNPGMHPGHEMSDLRNCPRQPAAEAVIHYARFAHIESFPQDPRSASSGHVAAPSMDAAVEKEAATKGKRKWVVTAACASSLIFHVALVAALLIGIVVTPTEPVEEAGETVSVIILGDSDVDQQSSGEDVEDPQPDQVVAESVQPETVQPTEVTPEQAQPAEPQAVAPTQQVTRVSPENATAQEPEVLTSQTPAETSVVQPMATQVPEEVPPETPPVAQATPEEVTPVQPTETAEVAPEPDATPTPTPKPKAETPVKKPKPVEKKTPPKKTTQAAGSKGDNKQDSKRGTADGSETAQSDHDSRSAGSVGGSGSAAVANYQGKLEAKLRRSMRVPTKFKRMGVAMTVRIRLTISSSGALSGLSVARSSGIPELDQAALDSIRRAAPFPPLPAEWGKPTWPFSQEVQLTSGR
ncbi:TonB family protein [Rhizobium sp. S152]|uniref:TonB family protein n=1 Tax=Rhizobium sp. S152 TaxID=3055038 RepID=UPI0025A99E34|nr:TonB family protein [Rhizobium sp. S152]MDM9625990.1 TonB family protein [Rhizobium sp. S152]